jgi:ATP-dependent DNA helicase RecG
MISDEQLQQMISQGESLMVEFKSDRRRISDREIYEEVVAMANASGGTILIGVEDNGKVTGSQARHERTTDPIKLQSAIFNNTVPSINTRVQVTPMDAGPVIAIQVDPYPEPCATMAGTALRRVIGPDGKPQSLPFYPRDQRSRRTDLGLLDFSAQEMEDFTFDDLDPLEFERLRQMVSNLRGDRALLELSDQELAQALRLVETHGKRLVPNVAGVLLLGRLSALRKAIPTHQVNFQVLDPVGDVKVNDLMDGPLLKVIQDIENRFAARNEERETLVGMIRLPIPDYSAIGFREAVNNALLHRDYSRLGAVYIQWYPDHLLITNPGGLPAGITPDNILVHEPKPRNPRLAEAFRRIGLVEQTGRGVDKIFMGQLRYGRPSPDYSRSDPEGVRVVLRGGEASLDFAAFVFEQDQAGKFLQLDDLLVLNLLFFERRIDLDRTEQLIQKGESQARAVLERLHERGLIEGRGEKRGRVYILSSALYQRFKTHAEYVRAKGFDFPQMEQMSLEYLQKHGRISRSDIAGLCKINEDQAYRLLRKLIENHPQIQSRGAGKNTYYIWAE